jgi:hypothetical protein
MLIALVSATILNRTLAFVRLNEIQKRGRAGDIAGVGNGH